MKTDFNNQELKVGDIVAFILPQYRELIRGEIVKICDQQLRLKWEDTRYYTSVEPRYKTTAVYPKCTVKLN